MGQTFLSTISRCPLDIMSALDRFYCILFTQETFLSNLSEQYIMYKMMTSFTSVFMLDAISMILFMIS